MPYIPILSSTLPAATPGRFKNIGYAFVRAPCTPWSLPTPTIDGKPALGMLESAYAVFYPAAEKPQTNKTWLGSLWSSLFGNRQETVPWMTPPASGVLQGYARFFGGKLGWMFPLISGVAGRFRFACTPNAPLAKSDKPLPLVIFSHGLAGTRHTYTQYCQALASEGYVVLAVEHRDGSGPCCMIPSENGGREMFLYSPFAKLNWDGWKSDRLPAGGTPAHPVIMDLRALQMTQRVREVYAAYESFKNIMADKQVEVVDQTPDERAVWVAEMQSGVDFDKVVLAGHSFGGGTVLHIIRSAPPGEYAPMPIKAVISLDPWLEPYPNLVGVVPSTIHPPPTLVINSQEFTQWKSHFPELVEISRTLGAAFVTIVGTGHNAFSDFPIIATLSLSRELGYLRTMHDLTCALLEDRLMDTPYMVGKPDDGTFETIPSGKMAGKKGSVGVHTVLEA